MLSRLKWLLVFWFFMANCLDAQSPKTIDARYNLIKAWGIIKYNSGFVSNGKINWDSVFIAQFKETDAPDSFYAALKKDINNYIPIKPSKHVGGNYTNIKLYGLDSSSNAALESTTTDSKGKGNFYTTARCKDGNLCFKNEIQYPVDSMKLPAYRFLIIARVWNIINFLYPFKEEIPGDWDEILKETLLKESSIKTTSDFEKLLLQLMVKLHDPHALFFGGKHGYLGDKFYPPITVAYIDSSLIITGVHDSMLDQTVHVGDKVVQIDNVRTDTIGRPAAQYISASHSVYRIDSYVNQYLLAGDSGTETDILIQNTDEKLRLIQTRRTYSFDTFILWRNKKALHQSVTDKGIYYADFSSPIDKKTFAKHIKTAKTVIVDLRKYPDMHNLQLIKKLSDRAMNGLSEKEPDFKHPGNFLINNYKPFRVAIKFTGKLLVLISNETMSRGEYFCLLLKVGNSNVLFVGDTTVGAIGQFTVIPLYKTAGVSYTGDGILLNSKSFQQRGIAPDISILQNRKDLINNKDAVFDKALEIAKTRE